MKYYAHSSDNPEKSWQEIAEHSKNTAKIAVEYVSKFYDKRNIPLSFLLTFIYPVNSIGGE